MARTSKQQLRKKERMTKIKILAFALMLQSIFAYGQRNNKTGAREIDNDIINPSYLIGRWVLTIDSLDTLTFEKRYYFDIYENDTTSDYYALSKSCNLKDTCNTPNSKNAYLLYFSKNGYVEECYEIFTLNRMYLSLMYNPNGKIFLFKKIH